jgi:hypothetical protein
MIPLRLRWKRSISAFVDCSTRRELQRGGLNIADEVGCTVLKSAKALTNSGSI